MSECQNVALRALLLTFRLWVLLLRTLVYCYPATPPPQWTLVARRLKTIHSLEHVKLILRFFTSFLFPTLSLSGSFFLMFPHMSVLIGSYCPLPSARNNSTTPTLYSFNSPLRLRLAIKRSMHVVAGLNLLGRFCVVRLLLLLLLSHSATYHRSTVFPIFLFLLLYIYIVGVWNFLHLSYSSAVNS